MASYDDISEETYFVAASFLAATAFVGELERGLASFGRLKL